MEMEKKRGHRGAELMLVVALFIACADGEEIVKEQTGIQHNQ
jgi:tellurite resistance protein